MKLCSILFALMGFATGSRAAFLWWKSSRIPDDPEIAPDDPVYGTMAQAEATKVAFKKAGKLNAKAAAWTAASVLANTLAAVAGAISY